MSNGKINIIKSAPDDVYKIREIQEITWIDTYPNKKAEITLEDIKSKFKDDNSAKGKEKMEEKKKSYQDKNRQAWIAEFNGKVIGFCVANKEKEKGRVSALYVLPGYQRKGGGGKLIKKALRWLDGNKDIYVNAVEYNLKAVNFYKKHGFSETGRRGFLDPAAVLPSGKKIPEVELLKKQ